MQNAQIKTFPDNPAVAAAFAADFHKWTTQPGHGGKLTVALSGGSTPKLLFQHLAENYADRIDWSNLLLFWGDERCVPPDDAESNYRMTKELLLNHVNIPAENVFRVHGESDPAAERERYEQVVRQHVQTNEAGWPMFDLQILGMGGDGHTASIFPHQIDLLKSPNVCEVATHPESGQRRITLTGPVLNASKRVAFLVTGSGKADVIAQIRHKTGRWETFPTAHIDNQGSMDAYFDEAAAAKL